jgi:hypothetical protein
MEIVGEARQKFWRALLCITKYSNRRKNHQMKIVLAEQFGMCFGVRDAIARADHWQSRRRSQFSASSYTIQSCSSGFGRKASRRAHLIEPNLRQRQ